MSIFREIKYYYYIFHDDYLNLFLVSTTTTRARREGVGVGVGEEKAEAAIPVNTLSPPEGNTTFLDGTNWCVARPGVSQVDLQNALDWACGLGMADCQPIQASGPCFQPDTLLSHASFAFNTYYQQNGNSDIACNFGGTATLTKKDPSKNLCLFTSFLHYYYYYYYYWPI